MYLVGTGKMASTLAIHQSAVIQQRQISRLDLTDEPDYMERGLILGKRSEDQADKWMEECSFLLDAVSRGTDMCMYIDESNPEITGRKIAALCNLK